MTITLTPEIEANLISTAARMGKSPEEVAFDRLRVKGVTRSGRPRLQRSDALKRVRTALKLTRSDMGALLGLPATKIARMEADNVLPRDEAALKALHRLARRHNISLKAKATS